MVTKLIARTGALAGRDFPVPADFTVLRIGAAQGAEVCIRADGVSREHARLVARADGCWLEDAGSSNGTFVNGYRIKSERLRHLDVVTLARRVDLIFVQIDKEPEAAAQPAVLAGTLEIINGASAGTTVDIPLGEITIGRATNCTVTFPHPSVGRVHARIVRTPAQITIEDLGSANGTFVNDRRIRIEGLRHNDRISLAGVAQFRITMRTELGAVMPAAPLQDTRIEPAYDSKWQTKYVWSPTELGAIARNPAKAIDLMEQTPVPVPPSPPPPAAPPASARPIPKPITSVYDKEKPTPPPAPRPPELSRKPLKSVELIGGPGGPVSLGPGQHAIGRGASATIQLTKGDREASRLHALITVTENDATVEDKSVNGTFVEGERVTKPRALRDGDRLRCGGTTFTVRITRR